MNIILLENLEKVGAKYEVVTVKDGYGRNYLIPKGIGIVANRQNLGKLKGIQRQQDAKANAMLGTYQGYANQLAGQTLVFTAKAGDSGRLFGSITASMLSEKLKEMGMDVDRRKIIMPDEVKELGSYTAKLDLHSALDVNVNFEVVSEDGAAKKSATAAPAAVVEQVVEAVPAAPIVETVAAPAVEEVVEAAAPVAAVEEVIEAAAPVAAVEEVVEAAAPVAAVEEVVEAAAPVAAVEEIVAPAEEAAEQLESAILDEAPAAGHEVAAAAEDALDTAHEA